MFIALVVESEGTWRRTISSEEALDRQRVVMFQQCALERLEQAAAHTAAKGALLFPIVDVAGPLYSVSQDVKSSSIDGFSSSISHVSRLKQRKALKAATLTVPDRGASDSPWGPSVMTAAASSLSSEEQSVRRKLFRVERTGLLGAATTAFGIVWDEFCLSLSQLKTSEATAKRKSASQVIARAYMGYRDSSRFRTFRCAALILQRVGRGFLSNKFRADGGRLYGDVDGSSIVNAVSRKKTSITSTAIAAGIGGLYRQKCCLRQIQRIGRSFLHRQRFFRGLLDDARSARQSRAATTVQSVFRMFRSRSTFTEFQRQRSAVRLIERATDIFLRKRREAKEAMEFRIACRVFERSCQKVDLQHLVWAERCKIQMMESLLFRQLLDDAAIHLKASQGIVAVNHSLREARRVGATHARRILLCSLELIHRETISRVSLECAERSAITLLDFISTRDRWELQRDLGVGLGDGHLRTVESQTAQHDEVSPNKHLRSVSLAEQTDLEHMASVSKDASRISKESVSHETSTTIPADLLAEDRAIMEKRGLVVRTAYEAQEHFAALAEANLAEAEQMARRAQEDLMSQRRAHRMLEEALAFEAKQIDLALRREQGALLVERCLLTVKSVAFVASRVSEERGRLAFRSWVVSTLQRVGRSFIAKRRMLSDII